MIKKIDHIGITVKDLKETMRIYSDIIGLELKGTGTIEEQKITHATFLAGEVKIELVQPTHPDSPISKFLEKRGEGMHHIAYCVDNGIPMIEGIPKQYDQYFIKGEPKGLY